MDSLMELRSVRWWGQKTPRRSQYLLGKLATCSSCCRSAAARLFRDTSDGATFRTGSVAYQEVDIGSMTSTPKYEAARDAERIVIE